MRSVLSHDVAKPAASAPCGGRLPCAKTIDEVERGRDDHHQPLRQIHLSRREICLKKRSHPSLGLICSCVTACTALRKAAGRTDIRISGFDLMQKNAPPRA